MTTVTVGALLTAAIGILLQYVLGVGDFPTIPPGPIILAVLAAIVAFFQNEGLDRFSDLTPLLGFLGLWIQVAGVIAAIGAGALATIRNYQHETPAR
jgi:hypothetical protein